METDILCIQNTYIFPVFLLLSLALFAKNKKQKKPHLIFLNYKSNICILTRLGKKQ